MFSGVFVNNRAKCGGALSIKNQEDILLHHSSITQNSESALCISDSTVTFQDIELSCNSGNSGGGVYSLNSILKFKGSNSLCNNTAFSGGAMYMIQGSVLFEGRMTVFSQNFAQGNGGAFNAVGIDVNLRQRVDFMYNSAQNGGAIYLKGRASMTPNLNSHLTFSFNKALGYGGGVYHEDDTIPAQCNFNESQRYLELLSCLFNFRNEVVIYQVEHN